MRTTISVFAALMGFGAIANGIFMLFAPANWYFVIPGVTNTGPFNQHFIRDIGMIYAFVGYCYIAGTRMAEWRTMLWSMGTVWLTAHGLFHIWEVAAGICGPRDLLIASPSVLLPPAIGIALSGWAYLNPPAVAN